MISDMGRREAGKKWNTSNNALEKSAGKWALPSIHSAFYETENVNSSRTKFLLLHPWLFCYGAVLSCLLPSSKLQE
jgi:hypothetical protein